MNSKQYAQNIEQAKLQLYKTALLYLGNESDAMEALDECVYKGLRSCRRLRKPEYFKTWITRILINTCNDELRRKQRVSPVEQLPEQPIEDFDSLPLKMAVAALPDELRMVVSLRFFGDLTMQQTADVMGIPRGTVSTWQRKAFHLLRLELDEGE